MNAATGAASCRAWKELGKDKPDVLGLIPARGGSKSIPRKNIKDLAGYPLIAYSIAAGRQSNLISRVIVTTDDEEIAGVARSFGAEVPFMRPAELARDDTTDYPVVRHALDWLAEHESWMPDIVVQLRPTSPVRPIGSIDESINLLMNDPAADSVRAITPSGQNPYKMWRTENGPYLSPILATDLVEPYNMPRQNLPATYWQTGHVDTFWFDTVLNQGSLTGKNILPLVIDATFSVDIDTLDNWQFADWVIRKGTLAMIVPDHPRDELLKDIREVIFDFDGVFTDNKVYTSETGEEMVMCDRSDGMGITAVQKLGIKVAVISSETNHVVAARCEKLGISCYHGVGLDKLDSLMSILQDQDISLDEIAYVGNDINDLDCLKAAGVAVVVADAYPEIFPFADIVLSKPGGHGAVREFCGLIARARATSVEDSFCKTVPELMYHEENE
jgi:N-acylneuraminate cytidylyltransferase